MIATLRYASSSPQLFLVGADIMRLRFFVDELAVLVNSRRLMKPFGVSLDADEKIGKARERIGSDGKNDVHLVREKGRVDMWCTTRDLFTNDGVADGGPREEHETVRAICHEIEIVPPNLPLWRVISTLASTPVAFVDDGGIVGYINQRSLEEPAVLLCLLALLLDLETAALDLCWTCPESFMRLTEDRRNKAMEVYQAKFLDKRQDLWGLI